MLERSSVMISVSKARWEWSNRGRNQDRCLSLPHRKGFRFSISIGPSCASRGKELIRAFIRRKGVIWFDSLPRVMCSHLLLAGGPICWRSMFQSLVALSTTGATWTWRNAANQGSYEGRINNRLIESICLFHGKSSIERNRTIRLKTI